MNNNQEVCIKPYPLMGIILAVLGTCAIFCILLVVTMLIISRKTKADMKIIRAELDQAKRLGVAQKKAQKKAQKQLEIQLEPEYDDIMVPESSWNPTNLVPSTPESGIYMGVLDRIPEEMENGYSFCMSRIQRPGLASQGTMAILEEPEYAQVEDTPPPNYVNKGLFLFKNQAYGLRTV